LGQRDPFDVPSQRLRAVGEAPERPERAYVLYWMIAQRRTRWSFALQRALGHARRLGKPLVVLEALRCDYPWASERLHRFVLDGMAVNRACCEAAGVRYLPYVEPRPGAGRGLLAALARRACAVVTDESPAFFLPRAVAAAGRVLDVRLEAVDGNGLLPLRAAGRAFPTAHAFRRHLQRELPEHLPSTPLPEPLRRARDAARAVVARDVLARWPMASARELEDPATLAALPIDHAVRAVPGVVGGAEAGERRLARFLERGLARYGERDLDDPPASGLSPYLHFGHVSAHEAAFRALAHEGWSPDRLATDVSGRREGWWGASRATEAFLDELVTWRELGYGFAYHRPQDHDRYESLPDWARATLEAHAGDRRPHLYALEEFAAARTHDELWNAAQRQLLREGTIHGTLRMLWGKKVLEWSVSPRAALAALVELNNRYALDGRDPNSTSGIFWTLGRFDRPWFPERTVYGVVRSMSSASTARKLRVRDFLTKYAAENG